MWMNLESIMFREISQTEKDRYSMLSLTCGILKIKQMNVYNVYNKRNRFTDIENKLVVTSGEGDGGGGEMWVWD